MIKLLYRQSLKEANKIPNYNIKSYFIRKIKEEYRNNRGDIKEAEETLLLLKRHSLVSKLYWNSNYESILPHKI